MGIFDLFSNVDQQAAANSQIGGIQTGQAQATGNINQGIGAINTGYTAALQPYLANQQTANAGTTQLGNVLGLNGPAGSQAASQTLQSTPGYQFQQQQGNAAINAQAAASGQNASGNQALALSQYNQGLAGTTYNNYVSQLQPYLGASNQAAAGGANVQTGQANALAGQYGNLANLNYTADTGIGNSQANADLGNLTASQNIMGAVGNVGKAALGIFSDVRLKDDIEQVGELFDGLPVYKYRYIGDNVFQIGLMAQDVEKTNPDAVGERAGFKTVDYNKATEYAADLSRFLEAA